MKSPARLIAITVLTLGLPGCNRGVAPDRTEGTPQSATVVLGQDFTLRPGESIRLTPGSLLRFVAVPEDSRCPPGVQCIWAGNAELSLALNETRFAINTTLEPHEAVVDGYRFQLVGLTQRPLGDTVATNYSATFKVTR